jgi:alkanesulfonate monooxygenase SsuD/methylene tetrahydromethanopterin reductase-like flavin-dependent oxidoreductase (luciferase family)
VRFSLQLPIDRLDPEREFHSPRGIAEMAACIESAGFDACWVTDHPAPTREWIATGGHQTLDPFVALSFAAATTTTLRLHTNAYIQSTPGDRRSRRRRGA